MPTRGSPGAVELRLGLARDVVDERLDVAGLVVGAVDLDRAAGVAEAARVPGQHVVAGRAQRADADAPSVGSVALFGVGVAPGSSSRARRAPSAPSPAAAAAGKK